MKHTKAPFVKAYPLKNNDMCLTPIDMLVYSYLYTYKNNTTHKCFPSMETLSKEIGIKADTVNKSIKALDLIGYINISLTVEGSKKRNEYTLNPINGFFMIPRDFILSKEYDTKLKAFIIAFRTLCFDDSYKCSYSIKQVADGLNMTPKTASKYLTIMRDNNIIKYNETHKYYKLNTDIINWRLDKIEKDIQDIKETKVDRSELEILKAQMKEQNELIEQLYIMIKQLFAKMNSKEDIKKAEIKTTIKF